MEARILVNGSAKEGVPGDDPGLLLGLTIFETIRCYEGGAFRLREHIDRLEASAVATGIPMPPRELIREEIAACESPGVRIRYTLTAGGNRILDAADIDPEGVGADMRLASMVWEPPPGLPGVVKHGSRAAWTLAARERDVDEILLLDAMGHVLEASRSSVVAVVGGRLRTPPLDGRQLASVTRGALIDAAGRSELAMDIAPVSLGMDMEELYLASTLKELAPVVQLDGGPGPGAGPSGARLYEAFRALVHQEQGQ